MLGLRGLRVRYLDCVSSLGHAVMSNQGGVSADRALPSCSARSTAVMRSTGV
jgi:hypothetical protein